jgi:hypothetical protein
MNARKAPSGAFSCFYGAACRDSTRRDGARRTMVRLDATRGGPT